MGKYVTDHLISSLKIIIRDFDAFTEFTMLHGHLL